MLSGANWCHISNYRSPLPVAAKLSGPWEPPGHGDIRGSLAWGDEAPCNSASKDLLFVRGLSLEWTQVAMSLGHLLAPAMLGVSPPREMTLGEPKTNWKELGRTSLVALPTLRTEPLTP